MNDVMRVLIEELNKASEALKKTEEETGIVYHNSPTVNVGYAVRDGFDKVEHSHPMLSLGKTKDLNEIKKFIGNEGCIVSLKMDGLSVLLTYEDGVLVRGETRGNVPS